MWQGDDHVKGMRLGLLGVYFLCRFFFLGFFLKPYGLGCERIGLFQHLFFHFSKIMYDL